MPVEEDEIPEIDVYVLELAEIHFGKLAIENNYKLESGKYYFGSDGITHLDENGLDLFVRIDCVGILKDGLFDGGSVILDFLKCADIVDVLSQEFIDILLKPQFKTTLKNVERLMFLIEPFHGFNYILSNCGDVYMFSVADLSFPKPTLDDINKFVSEL